MAGPLVGGQESQGEDGQGPPTGDSQRTALAPLSTPPTWPRLGHKFETQQKLPEKHKMATLVKEETSRPNKLFSKLKW